MASQTGSVMAQLFYFFARNLVHFGNFLRNLCNSSQVKRQLLASSVWKASSVFQFIVLIQVLDPDALGARVDDGGRE